MKCIVPFSILLIFVVVFFSNAYAAVYIDVGVKNKKYPNECFNKYYKMRMKYGKQYNVPGKCATMKCDKTYTIVEEDCGEIRSKDCKLEVKNLTKPYPQCCSKSLCN